MVVCGLAKQLFVLVACVVLFAMLMLFVKRGAALSCHINPLFRWSLSSDSCRQVVVRVVFHL